LKKKTISIIGGILIFILLGVLSYQPKSSPNALATDEDNVIVSNFSYDNQQVVIYSNRLNVVATSWELPTRLSNNLTKTLEQAIIYAAPEGVLSPSLGVVTFDGHKETYYDLWMGYFGEYSVREDGAKINPAGEILLACAEKYRGTTRMTSMGLGRCVDTGGFAVNNPEQIDIATDWSDWDGV